MGCPANSAHFDKSGRKSNDFLCDEEQVFHVLADSTPTLTELPPPSLRRSIRVLPGKVQFYIHPEHGSCEGWMQKGVQDPR